MEKQKKNNLPDFKDLNDRIIAQAPEGPFIGIRTNLDEQIIKQEDYTSLESRIKNAEDQ